MPLQDLFSNVSGTARRRDLFSNVSGTARRRAYTLSVRTEGLATCISVRKTHNENRIAGNRANVPHRGKNTVQQEGKGHGNPCLFGRFRRVLLFVHSFPLRIELARSRQKPVLYRSIALVSPASWCSNSFAPRNTTTQQNVRLLFSVAIFGLCVRILRSLNKSPQRHANCIGAHGDQPDIRVPGDFFFARKRDCIQSAVRPCVCVFRIYLCFVVDRESRVDLFRISVYFRHFGS